MFRFALLTLLVATACGDIQPEFGTAEDGSPDHSESAATRVPGPGLEDDDHAGEAREIRLTPDQVEVMSLETGQAAYRSFHRDVRTTGEVELNEERMVRIVSKVTGWIERLDAFERDEVGAGQTLSLVYSPDYLTALTELLQADRRVVRARGADNPDAVRTAESIVQAARQKLRLLGADAAAIDTVRQSGVAGGYFELQSPMGGTVVESHAVLGSAIEPGSELFHIANLSTLWVRVDVHEDDLRFVNEGDEITLIVKAYPDQRFEGRITQMGGLLDSETRTVKARAVVQNSDRRLRPGMFADIVVHTQPLADQVPSVPAAAIQTLEDVPIVFVAEDEGRYTIREVELGEEEDGIVLVHQGLSPGERVVTRGSFLLKAELLKGTFEAGHGH